MRVLQNHSLYRHYKGALYYVIGWAPHTESGEALAIYHALDGENELHIRPLDMFLSEVQDSEGTTINRFELVLSVKD